MTRIKKFHNKDEAPEKENAELEIANSMLAIAVRALKGSDSKWAKNTLADMAGLGNLE